jgi:hypothetical protein
MFEKVPKKPLQKLLKLSDNEPVEFYGEVYRSEYSERKGKKMPVLLKKLRKAISFPEDHGEDNDGNMLVSYENGKPLLRGIKKVLKKNFDVDVVDTFGSECKCRVIISSLPNDKVGIKLKTNQNYTKHEGGTTFVNNYSIPARFWNILPSGFEAKVGSYSGNNDDGQYDTQDVGYEVEEAFMVGISEVMPNLKLKDKKASFKLFEDWLSRTEDRFLERTAQPNFNNEGSRGEVWAEFNNRQVELSTTVRDGEFIEGEDEVYEEII